MPLTQVLLFRDEDGSVPILDWLESLPEKAQDKCVVRIERLAALGRREHATLPRGPAPSHARGADLMARKTTTDAVKIVHRRIYKGKPRRLAALADARASADVARQIHALRTAAGLSQAALAELVGTSRSVISRLEADDYAGHSLTMLRRVAAAFGRRVEIRFVPAK